MTIMHFRKGRTIRSFDMNEGTGDYEFTDRTFPSINAAKKESRTKHGLFNVAKVDTLPVKPR